MSINKIIPQLSILNEVSELFDYDIKALAIAVHRFSDGKTINKIHSDLLVSKWKKYEDALVKCSELYAREIEAYKSRAKIDYSECVKTLGCTFDWMRLNDFTIDEETAVKELKNLDEIIKKAKQLHSTISKMRGKPLQYHEQPKLNLFEGVDDD